MFDNFKTSTLRSCIVSNNLAIEGLVTDIDEAGPEKANKQGGLSAHLACLHKENVQMAEELARRVEESQA